MNKPTVKKGGNKKKIAALTIAGALLVGGVIAYLTDMVSFTNTFNFNGKVDTTAGEYTDDTHTTPYTDPETVMPGDVINKVPTIKQTDATGADTWVRAKIEFTQPSGITADMTELGMSNLNIDTAKWTIKTEDGGTYAYLNAGINKGDSAYHDLFTKVTIPSDWNNAVANGTAKVKVTFQSIQKANVTQDLTSATPWGTISDSDINAN